MYCRIQFASPKSQLFVQKSTRPFPPLLVAEAMDGSFDDAFNAFGIVSEEIPDMDLKESSSSKRNKNKTGKKKPPAKRQKKQKEQEKQRARGRWWK